MSAPRGAMDARRVVLITGAARGLGRAIALHLAAPGTLLLLHYRSSEREMEALLAEAKERGAEAVALRADLGKGEERERLMDEVAGHGGVLHVLVNNVGTYLDKGLAEITPAEWSATLEATCTAAFHLTQRALPLLRKGAPARVINLGDSAAGRITARTHATPYHIAKIGVSVLTRSYGKLLAGEGITVNQISPGFLENSIGEPGSALPAGRKGRFEDLLPALDYLLSPEAEYVTGADLVVSGGWNL